MQVSDDPSVLGYIVLYGATTTKDATFDEAAAAIGRHGLVHMALQPPTPLRAFSRAMRVHEASDLRARKAVNDAEKSVTVLIRELHEIGTEQFDYEPEDRAEFNKKTQKLTVQGDRQKAIEADFRHYSAAVIGDDVRQMTRRVIEKLDGVSLRGSVDVRDAGGVYFVPAHHREQLQALMNVLEELHIGYLRTFGVVRGAAEEIQVAISAEVYVEKQVGDIVRAIKDIKSRAVSVERHKKDLLRLQEILQKYAAMAGRKTPSALLKKVSDALALADARIAELTPKPKPTRRGKRPSR